MPDTYKFILVSLQNNEDIKMMAQYMQHGDVNTYKHCCNVAIIAMKMTLKFKMREYKIINIAIGAMLHDFYLYDYHVSRRVNKKWHAFIHPEIALKNASEIFVLNKRQRNIIRSHMFPATILHVPIYAESWIVNLADKYCAIRELSHYILFKKQWEACI